MTQQHPITHNPPPELVKAWLRERDDSEPMFFHIAAMAAQWGADRELEACRQWLEINGARRELIDGLLVARCCSEPPGLKEEALADLDAAYEKGYINTVTYKNIRRALEQLND